MNMIDLISDFSDVFRFEIFLFDRHSYCGFFLKLLYVMIRERLKAGDIYGYI